MSLEEAARSRDRENVRLARNRVRQQLETSANSRHRKLLQETLEALDQKLRKLESGAEP